jgi:hypothetical protein
VARSVPGGEVVPRSGLGLTYITSMVLDASIAALPRRLGRAPTSVAHAQIEPYQDTARVFSERTLSAGSYSSGSFSSLSRAKREAPS